MASSLAIIDAANLVMLLDGVSGAGSPKSWPKERVHLLAGLQRTDEAEFLFGLGLG